MESGTSSMYASYEYICRHEKAWQEAVHFKMYADNIGQAAKMFQAWLNENHYPFFSLRNLLYVLRNV